MFLDCLKADDDQSCLPFILSPIKIRPTADLRTVDLSTGTGLVFNSSYLNHILHVMGSFPGQIMAQSENVLLVCFY